MRAAIYVRVSTRDKGQDTDNQLAQLRVFAGAMGWDITEVYTDEASGGSGDRPGFRKMFDDASRRRWDIVLFWSMDRLSREGTLATLNYLQRLSSYGIAWRSYTEQFLDSTGVFKEAIVSILATLAKQEKVRIGERTRAGLDRARRNGKTLGRPKTVAEAAVIKVRRLRADGGSWTQIAASTGLTAATARRVAIGAGCYAQ